MGSVSCVYFENLPKVQNLSSSPLNFSSSSTQSATVTMGSAPQQSKLFEPLQLGPYKLSNRLAMAPLTRFRADDNHVQLPFAAEYYAQRACVPGTLIITEATFISPEASGYPNIPGIWREDQINAWKNIVDAVHKKGGVIFLQLWALGRTASPDFKKSEGTGDLVSASDLPMSDNSPAPRPMTEEEIQTYIKQYAQAAKNAVEGARFAIEVSKAVVEAVGAQKTGIRLSPWSVFQGMRMEDPIPQFSYLMQELKKLQLGYVHLVESRIAGNADVEKTEKIDPFIDIWDGTSPILVAGGFKPASARTAVDQEYKGKDVMVVFGRYFISTPDLVYRLEKGIDFTPYDRDTFYKAKSTEGYLDYPFSQEWVKEKGEFKL